MITLQKDKDMDETRNGVHDFTLLEILTIGVQTVWSEWKWIIIRTMRNLEIRQLRKRLDTEYRRIGKAQLHEPENEDELRLCKQQISFIEEEIAHLEKELDKTRHNFIAKRIQELKLS
ncbi:MAG: hypothetical protein ACOC0K_00025 [bacterium]